MFCPKCGSILLPKKDDSKKMLVCACGYRASRVEGIKIREVVNRKEKDVEVVDKGLETLPKTKITCPKCGHNEAYFWLVQTRAGDEPETKFLRCVKCSRVWRDYD